MTAISNTARNLRCYEMFPSVSLGKEERFHFTMHYLKNCGPDNGSFRIMGLQD